MNKNLKEKKEKLLEKIKSTISSSIVAAEKNKEDLNFKVTSDLKNIKNDVSKKIDDTLVSLKKSNDELLIKVDNDIKNLKSSVEKKINIDIEKSKITSIDGGAI
jgi:hypothetical protein